MKPDRDILASQYTLLPMRDSKLAWQKRLSQKVALYRRHYRTRRQLARLTVEQLNDIGLTRQQAHNESQKLFWES